MSTRATDLPNNEAPASPPKCPHCGGSLADLQRYSWIAPPWLTLGLVCPNPECLTLLHVQIVPMTAVPQEETQPAPGPGRGPRILKPS
jgi:hypothetical protein